MTITVSYAQIAALITMLVAFVVLRYVALDRGWRERWVDFYTTGIGVWIGPFAALPALWLFGQLLGGLAYLVTGAHSLVAAAGG